VFVVPVGSFGSAANSGGPTFLPAQTLPSHPMQVHTFTFSPFMTNCYLCHDDGEAILVDASCATEEEQQQVVEVIREWDLDLKHLLLTHAHIDHILGCHFFEETFGMQFQAHAAARAFIEKTDEQAAAFGVQLEAAPTMPTTWLDEGDTVAVGSVSLDVLHTPGHSPDSISFVDRSGHQALTGDVLFQNSIGRIEGLPRTSRTQLLTSITEKVLPLGDETTIYPGHGPTTTVGQERQHNPFVQEALQQ